MFGNAFRDAIGGGEAWITSVDQTRRAAGAVIDVPLAFKDEIWVRSHYDAIEVRVPDAPHPDEIVVIAAVANRGRINARVGGMTVAEARAAERRVSGSIAVTGAGCVLSGDFENPVLDGRRHGRQPRRCHLGDRPQATNWRLRSRPPTSSSTRNGATVAPGLIDSHCHVVLGDYTPRQKTVDFLASYVHGGITSVVSPGEIHAQGRPHSAVGRQGLGHRGQDLLRELPSRRHDRPRGRGGPRAHAAGQRLRRSAGRWCPTGQVRLRALRGPRRRL